MISLSSEDVRLLETMVQEISKEKLGANWEDFMEITPDPLRQPGGGAGGPVYSAPT